LGSTFKEIRFQVLIFSFGEEFFAPDVSGWLGKVARIAALFRVQVFGSQ
jgi:hypothetical protein